MPKAKISDRELKRQENQTCELCDGKLPRQRFRFCSRACADASKKPELRVCFCGKVVNYPKSIYCSSTCSAIKRAEKDNAGFEQRFIDLMGRTDDPEECWLWLGFKDNQGYGIYGAHGKRTSQKAHRISYELLSGPIPEGLIVRHSCDVKACVNINHLVLGTNKDNKDDFMKRGKHGKTVMFRPGEINPNAALSNEQVKEIRLIYSPFDPTLNRKALAERFGVGTGVIRKIVLNLTYFDSEYKPIELSLEETEILRGRKLTMDQAREVRKLYQSGHTPYSTEKLGKMFGVTSEVIRKIILNKSYKE